MGKRETGAERRERLEAIQREQKAAARKRNLLTAGIGIGVGVLLIGGTVAAISVQSKNKPSAQPFSAFGVSAAAANCSEVGTKKSSGSNNHVGPGTDSPQTVKVDYETIPPSFGPHYPTWLDPSIGFYSPQDNPQVEQLVHNLEHGHRILWYQPSVSDAEQQTLKDLSQRVRADRINAKFIVAPWDDNYGEFPEPAKIAMSQWGTEVGSIQFCEEISGEAVKAFVDEHPSLNSPEPNAP